MSGPAVTVGLPVRNGERFLAQSLESLLAQTFLDAEFVVSDNASTDRTREICARYSAEDPRVHYVRQLTDLGAAANHNAVLALARGRYFKWASHDDLWAPTLLARSVDVLDRDPGVVLVQSREAVIDERGHLVGQPPPTPGTADPRPWIRLRSLLGTPRAEDIYGLIRTEVLRKVGPHGSYCGADRVLVASLCLQGPFQEVPEVLYFRREHAGRASRAPGRRARAAVLDPVRADRWRHPLVRMDVERVAGYLEAVGRADLGAAAAASCLAVLACSPAPRLLRRSWRRGPCDASSADTEGEAPVLTASQVADAGLSPDCYARSRPAVAACEWSGLPDTSLSWDHGTSGSRGTGSRSGAGAQLRAGDDGADNGSG